MTEQYSDVCMSCKPIKSDKKTVLTAFECKCLLLYCFWYLQMNSTGMEPKAHLDQKNGQQRSSVPSIFWALKSVLSCTPHKFSSQPLLILKAINDIFAPGRLQKGRQQQSTQQENTCLWSWHLSVDKVSKERSRRYRSYNSKLHIYIRSTYILLSELLQSKILLLCHI